MQIRQAYAQLVRVVRSSPHKLHTVFEKAAKRCDLADSHPECRCWEQASRLAHLGPMRNVQGRLAVVLLQIIMPSGKLLRPRDPLLVNGLRAHDVACEGITPFTQQINGTTPDLATALPREVFHESSSDLKYVQKLAFVLYYIRPDRG